MPNSDLYLGCIRIDASTLAGHFSLGQELTVVAHTAAGKTLTAADNMDALKATLAEYDATEDFRYVSHVMSGRGGKMHKINIYYKQSGGRDFNIDCVFTSTKTSKKRKHSTA